MTLEEAERRHGCQLRAVEERLATERDAWQENYTRRQETVFLAREREMRESLRQERDKVCHNPWHACTDKVYLEA